MKSFEVLCRYLILEVKVSLTAFLVDDELPLAPQAHIRSFIEAESY